MLILKLAFSYFAWMLIIGFIIWLLGLVGFYFPLYAANPWGFLAVMVFILICVVQLYHYINSLSSS